MPTHVGCDIDGLNPADGIIRRVQVHGQTLDVTQRSRAYNRTTQPRMSEFGMFHSMFEGASSLAYRRADRVATMSIGEETSDPLEDPEQSSMPLNVAVYQQGTDPTFNTVFYLDNVSLKVSTILWEFSIDAGATWYPIVSAINVANARLLFPSSSTSIIVRATSTNVDDWVCGYVLTPIFNVLSERHM